MSHTLTLTDAGSQILFTCTVCSRQISFARMGEGEPHATYDNETQVWEAPEDYEAYLSPCEIPVEPEIPVPASITKRQFLIQLLRSGMVAESEVPTLAITPPAFLQAVFDTLTSELQLEAHLTWASMTGVDRYGALTQAAAAGAGTTEQQLDDFFRAAGQI